MARGGVCPRRHRQEAPRLGRFALHIATDFSVTLFEKIDLKQALTMEEYKPDTSQITKQLNLFVLTGQQPPWPLFIKPENPSTVPRGRYLAYTRRPLMRHTSGARRHTAFEV